MQNKASKTEPNLSLTNLFYDNRKYRILEILNKLPTDLNKIYKKQIPKNLNINRQTWSNWLNLSVTDKTEIPSIKLAYIAHYLKIEISDLINIPIAPPVIQSVSQIQDKTILESTGLTR